jgi:hypothetical protein
MNGRGYSNSTRKKKKKKKKKKHENRLKPDDQIKEEIIKIIPARLGSSQTIQ